MVVERAVRAAVREKRRPEVRLAVLAERDLDGPAVRHLALVADLALLGPDHAPLLVMRLLQRREGQGRKKVVVERSDVPVPQKYSR